MGLVDRFERKLESGLGDAFARVFGGSIVPQEVESMLQREADAKVRELQGGHILAPNDYVITLSVPDHQKVSADPDLTSTSFARHLEGYIHDQGWQTYGEVVVSFEPSPNLHTGQLRVRGAVNPDSRSAPSPTPMGASAPASSHRANTAEPGVPSMTDNPNYRGGQGQGQQPGDEYYDYGRQGDDQRRPYPPQDQGGYPPPAQGAPGYPPRQGATPTRAATPSKVDTRTRAATPTRATRPLIRPASPRGRRLRPAPGRWLRRGLPTCSRRRLRRPAGRTGRLRRARR